MRCGYSNDVIHKEVVVIGNGPSGIALSYMLSGNIPYLISNDHPDEYLSARLRPALDQTLVKQDLRHLAEGLEGRSTNPISLLIDCLLHPCADIGLEMEPLVEWRRDGAKIDHIVLGKGPPGGAWHSMDPHILTLSLGAWMALPGKVYEAKDGTEKRASAKNVAAYYEQYVKEMNLEENFRNGVIVTHVQYIGDDRPLIREKAKSFEAQFLDKLYESKSAQAKLHEGKSFQGRSFEGKTFQGKTFQGKSLEGKSLESIPSEVVLLEAKTFDNKWVQKIDKDVHERLNVRNQLEKHNLMEKHSLMEKHNLLDNHSPFLEVFTNGKERSCSLTFALNYIISKAQKKYRAERCCKRPRDSIIKHDCSPDRKMREIIFENEPCFQTFEDHSSVKMENTMNCEDDSMHCKNVSMHCKDNSMHSNDNSMHCKDNSMHCKDNSMHCKDNSMHCKDNSMHCKDNSMHCKDNSTHCKDNSMHCKDNSMHRKENSMHCKDCREMNATFAQRPKRYTNRSLSYSNDSECVNPCDSILSRSFNEQGSDFRFLKNSHSLDFSSDKVPSFRNKSCHTNGVDSNRKRPLWLVQAFDVNTKTPLTFTCNSLVLANGTSDLPNRLAMSRKLKEDPHWLLHDLKSLEIELDLHLQENPTSQDPVLIVGAGLSAADAVIATRARNMPVIHVFRNKSADLNKQLPENMYPEYHKVHQMMKDSTHPFGSSVKGSTYPLYTAVPEYTLTDISSTSRTVTLTSVTGKTIEFKVSFAVVLIGSRPNMNFFPNHSQLGVKKDAPIDSKSNNVDINKLNHMVKGYNELYAIGPLAGDNFVRFLPGGALAIVADLYKKHDC